MENGGSDFTLEHCRRFFADEIGAVSGISSAALVAAFARVPRERFLGPPPWQFSSGISLRGPAYRTTSDARDLYHDVFVAIRSARSLNNGQPGMIARLIAALDLKGGGRVFHVGCGTGYYSAIMAEMVGEEGQIIAVEIEPKLAAMARANLLRYSNVTVLTGDGGDLDPGPADAILVSAGVTHPPLKWLASLSDGGVLVLPLRVGRVAGAHDAMVIRIVRRGDRFAAEPVTILTIYPSASLNDPGIQSRLNRSFESRVILRLQSVRTDAHSKTDSCIVHTPGFCLSAVGIGELHPTSSA